MQFKWRNHDPQIGRFIEVDPLSEEYEYNSTYAFSENKVTTHVELEGLEAEWFERQVERDLRDIQSGKITTEQLEQRVNARNAIGSAIFTKVIVPIAAAALGGEVATAYKIIRSLARSGKEETPTIETGTSNQNTKSNFGEIGAKAEKETGSYTNTHESGRTYSGKGNQKRAAASARRVSRENNDPHTETDYSPAQNDREAFKQEDRRIEKNGGVENPGNYNKINSPGRKYNLQDAIKEGIKNKIKI